MDLYERIKKIKEQQSQKPSPAAKSSPAHTPSPTRKPSPPPETAGSRHETRREIPPAPAPSDGAARARSDGSDGLDESAPAESRGWISLYPMVWTRVLNYELSPPSSSPHPGLGWNGSGWDEYRYYDTETTGLSSGAGTYVFLFGSGRFTDQGFQVQQWFLGDFPWEPEFLTAMGESMEEEAVYVSYNGRSFDYPLLTSRYVMNGLVCPMYRQLDLLYIARRLFGQGLERCRLSDMEDHVLNIRRELDIPGSEIPDLYFRVQREADLEIEGKMPSAYRDLEPVFAHHAQDIVSLARLHIRMHRELENLQQGVLTPAVSVKGAARQLLSAGMEKEALDILREHAAGQRELLMLAGLLKRRREYEAAFPVWQKLFETYRDHDALTNILIEFEHRRKDYSSALRLIDRVLQEERSGLKEELPGLTPDAGRDPASADPGGSGNRAAQEHGAEDIRIRRLEYRRERIRRKISRRG
ncbi:ribonuclease H-like domain-containing protein [Salinispira pacifica]|uniref:YprB ribonuclease H-like domain-containing protein n=1 Tax=Salinispira pacifica TaxID=1307761 RepID=V5WGE9_9SPIO|nr:ribonuclease H-like domain-containing protein [Salinispira pacifica]AHC14624.1 hypothetical protein L21SP2_1223 [Salinispira pacifica]